MLRSKRFLKEEKDSIWWIRFQLLDELYTVLIIATETCYVNFHTTKISMLLCLLWKLAQYTKNRKPTHANYMHTWKHQKSKSDISYIYPKILAPHHHHGWCLSCYKCLSCALIFNPCELLNIFVFRL